MKDIAVLLVQGLSLSASLPKHPLAFLHAAWRWPIESLSATVEHSERLAFVFASAGPIGTDPLFS